METYKDKKTYILFEENIIEELNDLKRKYPDFSPYTEKVSGERVMEIFSDKDIIDEKDIFKDMHTDDFFKNYLEILGESYKYTDVFFAERNDGTYDIGITSHNYNEEIYLLGTPSNISKQLEEKIKSERFEVSFLEYNSLEKISNLILSTPSEKKIKNVKYMMEDFNFEYEYINAVYELIKNKAEKGSMSKLNSEYVVSEIIDFQDGKIISYTESKSKNKELSQINFLDNNTFTSENFKSSEIKNILEKLETNFSLDFSDFKENKKTSNKTMAR